MEPSSTPNNLNGLTPMLEIFVDLLGMITSIPLITPLLTLLILPLSTSDPPSIKVLVMKLWLSLISNFICSKKVKLVLITLLLLLTLMLMNPSVTFYIPSIMKTGLMLIITTGLSLMLKATPVMITPNQVLSVLDSEWPEVTLI
jgi:hypothetical protein